MDYVILLTSLFSLTLFASEVDIAESRCYFDFGSQIKDKKDDKQVTNYCSCYMDKTKDHWNLSFFERLGNTENLLRSRDICASKNLGDKLFEYHYELYYFKFFDAEVESKTERRYGSGMNFLLKEDKWRSFVGCHQDAIRSTCKRLIGLQAVYNCQKDAWDTMNHDNLYRYCLNRPVERKPAQFNSGT